MEELAGDLGVIPARAFDDLAARGFERGAVTRPLETTRLVAAPRLLPIGPPVPRYQEFKDSLRQLECLYFPALLHPEDPLG